MRPLKVVEEAPRKVSRDRNVAFSSNGGEVADRVAMITASLIIKKRLLLCEMSTNCPSILGHDKCAAWVARIVPLQYRAETLAVVEEPSDWTTACQSARQM